MLLLWSHHTTRPVKHGRVFLVPCKKWLVYTLYTRTLDKSCFSRYQKHTVMFNWAPCISGLHRGAEPLRRGWSGSTSKVARKNVKKYRLLVLRPRLSTSFFYSINIHDYQRSTITFLVTKYILFFKSVLEDFKKLCVFFIVKKIFLISMWKKNIKHENILWGFLSFFIFHLYLG